MDRRSACIHAGNVRMFSHVVSSPVDDFVLVASPEIDADEIGRAYYQWRDDGVLNELFPNLVGSISVLEMVNLVTRPYPHLGVTVRRVAADGSIKNIAYGWSGNYQQGPAGVSGCEVSFALEDFAQSRLGTQAARLALACLFSNHLTLQHCYSIVPSRHKKARMFCAGIGMSPVGVMSKGFWFEGEPDDAAIFSFASDDLEKFFSFSLNSSTIDDKGQVQENDERQKQFREESASPTS